MRSIFYISLFSILFFAYSCNNKTTSKFSEIQSISEAQGEPLGKVKTLEALSQTELFENMVDAMVLNDTIAYNKYIAKFNNIDTLILYTPSGDEDEEYYSLLGLACRSNSLYAMKDLIVRGADIRLGSENEFSALDALYYVILGGNAEMVKILIDKKTDVNVIYTGTGITPLVLAVIHKKYVMAEILLKAGAKVNGAGDMGDDYILYPLHSAIQANDVEMVKLLLKYNADTQLKDKEGLNALALAKEMKANGIVPLLTKN